jgi:hypothetical protein
LAIEVPFERTPHDARYPTTRIGGALASARSPPTDRGVSATVAAKMEQLITLRGRLIVAALRERVVDCCVASTI